MKTCNLNQSSLYGGQFWTSRNCLIWLGSALSHSAFVCQCFTSSASILSAQHVHSCWMILGSVLTCYELMCRTHGDLWPFFLSTLNKPRVCHAFINLETMEYLAPRNIWLWTKVLDLQTSRHLETFQAVLDEYSLLNQHRMQGIIKCLTLYDSRMSIYIIWKSFWDYCSGSS